LLGGGDLRSLLRANLDDFGWFARPASWLGEALTCPLEPLRYVGDIAPRPVFMLNATADPAIPTRCSELLHAAAGKPKTVRWIEAGHVTITETDFHQLITHELVAWLVEEDLIAPHNFVAAE
jgi:fermentation-respiration switch protein FrsA (DUF1100 family)